MNEGYWLGKESLGKVVCIDSPGGFVDKETKHEKEIEQAFRVDFLKTVVSKGVDSLLLVLNINDPNMEFGMSATYAMLVLIFGEEIRKHTAFVFTHCDPETKNKWGPKKEQILKEWNAKISLNNIEPKLDFPIFFTSMKTQEGLLELKQAVEKMGRFETKDIKQWREILEDEKKTDQDFEDAISVKFKCSIL